MPITANVDGTFYPVEGGDSKTAILEKLAPQMASSVEWTKQIETMYDAGGRLFVEVGPKRALTMFAMQILEGQPHVPIMTNHPKQGGIASFMTAIGALALAGRPPSWPALDSKLCRTASKRAPSKPVRLLLSRLRPPPPLWNRFAHEHVLFPVAA